MIDVKKQHKLIDYPDAVSAMEARVAQIITGERSEQLWLLEHPPIYTSGTSANPQDLINAQFPVFETGRGGEFTYHGPGQRVGYAMMDLGARDQKDLRLYVHNLEQWVINALDEFDVRAERRSGRIGLWVRTGLTEAKIAAIGVRVRKWVTFHGVAINNTPDLAHFNGIVPCGIREYGVTSLKDLGVTVSMDVLDGVLEKHFKDIFGP